MFCQRGAEFLILALCVCIGGGGGESCSVPLLPCKNVKITDPPPINT